MNRIIVLLLLVFVFAGCSQPKQPEKANPSADSQVVEIAISTPSMWLLRVERDGSGQVGFGQVGTDFARCPAGTFDFASLQEQFRSLCVSTGTISQDFSIAFRGEGASSTTAMYFNDAQLARELFSRAVESAITNRNRVEELFKTRPPVPHNK